jgi:hypothetical protein
LIGVESSESTPNPPLRHLQIAVKPKRRDLQLEATAHIAVQTVIDSDGRKRSALRRKRCSSSMYRNEMELRYSGSSPRDQWGITP